MALRGLEAVARGARFSVLPSSRVTSCVGLGQEGGMSRGCLMVDSLRNVSREGKTFSVNLSALRAAPPARAASARSELLSVFCE